MDGKEPSGGQGGEERTERKDAAAASKEESAARNRPGAAEAAVAGRQLKQQDKRGQDKPRGSPATPGTDTQLPSALSTLDGTRDQDLDGPQETDQAPLGSAGESEVEAGGEEPSAWDVKLQPDDFVPQRDLDVSAVPTADKLDPSTPTTPPDPSFATPPPTRAEQVQAEREKEDAEDDTTTEPEEEAAAQPEPEPSVETEGGPDSATALGGQAAEQAAALARLGSTSRDPKSGDDPKRGPVTAQTTVQEAAGKSEGGSGIEATTAKEEKGTAAGGKGSGEREPESQKTTGGPSPRGDTEAKEPGGGGGSDAPGALSSGASSRSEAPGVSSTQSAGEQPVQESRTEPDARPQTHVSKPAPAAPKPQPASVKATSGEKTEQESAPAPRAARAGALRGGGGGGAAPARGRRGKGSGAVPNLAGVSPEAGLATASKLKPHTALQAMGGVGGAVDRSVGDEHKVLAAAPPSMERPVGAPQTLAGKPTTDAPAAYSQDKPMESQVPEPENAEVTGGKKPEGQIEAEKAEEPGGWDTFKMALGFIGGKIVNGVAGFFGADKPVVDPQELAAKFAGLPTKDEALKQAQAGNAPGVGMQGGAGQASAEQGGHVDAKGQETLAAARDDAGRGMGEDQIYPDAPKEEMTAQVPGAQGGAGGPVAAGGATGAVPPEAASEVAEHEQGPQFQAAFSDGTRSMSEGRQAKDRDFRDSQAQHQQKVDAEIASNTEAQARERAKATADVTAQRQDWRTEQDQELKGLGDKKTQRQKKVLKDVEDEEKKTDDNVGKEKKGSDKKIQEESDKAERDAAQQRDGAVKESGNWISKAFEWIKQKVIEIKNAIVRVIRTARNAVIGFIKNFKETVERWINDVRKKIVEAIKKFIKDLIELAVALVRAVIELAARIRTFITSLITAAIALVNRLAQALKQAISDLLNAIGKLLSGILDLLKKALLAAVRAIVAAVKAVLDFASKLLSALGAWMMIAVDFLSDPAGWLSGARNSAVDGAKNHLFREVSSAVKTWFQEKIQEIIGVPKAIIDKLIKGGITLDKIVKEAWEAVVPQLPLIIGELVVTKVVAKLIPGAGWVMAVIDAIRTAWGALSAILRSLGAVLDWLKAVRTGGAGILFAKAVAAGAVALLEVLYQALLSGIGKYVAKVGRCLKGVAARLDKSKEDKQGSGKSTAAEDSDNKNRDSKPSASVKKPGPAAKTQTATAPKHGQGRDGATGKPKSQGDGRTLMPTTNKDTKPTPKPKPESAPRPKPQRDGDSTTPTARDKDSATPKNDGKDPTQPKGPGKPTNKDDGKDPNRAKAGDKDPPDMRKPDADHDRGKDRTDSKGPMKPKRDRHEDRRSKDRGLEKEKRDQRKKEEESKDSKDARLQKILVRLRPKLQGLLNRGTSERTFKALLVPLRAWYRLTRLEKEGSRRFDITAVLNPQEKVVDGMDVNIADRLLLILQRLGEEYRIRALRRQREGGVQEGSATDSPRLAGRLAPNDLARRSESDPHQVTSGTSPYQQSGMIQSIPALTEGPTSSFVDQVVGGEVIASVRRTQGGRQYKNPTADNQLVHWTSTDSNGRRTSAYMSHDDFTDMLSNDMTVDQRRELAQGALDNVAGRAAAVGDQQNALELKHWFFDIEGWRDPATHILTTMGLDMASRGQGRVNTPDGVVDYGDLAQFARDFPMRAKAKPGAVDPSKRVGGAVAIRKSLVRYFTRVKNYFKNPNTKSGRPRARPYLNTDNNAAYEQALMRRRPASDCARVDCKHGRCAELGEAP
ncbi:hypothetical protein [Streptomyces yaizuensis]|uniref:Uncharacterized protein n=1 Tax=Streptomyces yaizuensis TaxID=2989713 RepID=A0ABQ5NXR0_9ACTN|nr:hypothetical protein [Streptomyces sp. YSPA8]GLF95148.1 hypothetical protein SYYSPA8_12645 [Streptomyces sp. YSPA8]